MIQQPSKRRLVQEQVRLATLAEVRLVDGAVSVNATIEGYEFVDCLLLGPAVVYLDRCHLENPRWRAPGGLPALFWEIPRHREVIIGAIRLLNCTLVGCTFEAVGIAGPPEMREELGSSFRREEGKPPEL